MAGGENPFAVIVEFGLISGSREEFLRLVKENAQTSLAREPGCFRFDVLMPEDGAANVHLYEIYEDRAAFEAHLRTPHFRTFDAATKEMVAGKTVRSFLVVGPSSV